MRQLAKIRTITDLLPIPGADAIECAVVDGWQVVVKRGEFQIGDDVVYIEVDSWVPEALAPFLTKGSKAKEYNGVVGNKLKTVRLRGQISQGLILPLTDEMKAYASANGTRDLTEFLGIQKWEAPIPASLAGQMRGSLPSWLPKTDQERIQNCFEEVLKVGQARSFIVEEKLEGSSMTVYCDLDREYDEQLGVTSRNIDLAMDQKGNTFVDIAKASGILEPLRTIARVFRIPQLAVRGELIGEGVQGNIYGLKGHQFRIFDIFIGRAEDLHWSETLSGHPLMRVQNRGRGNIAPEIRSMMVQLMYELGARSDLAPQVPQLDSGVRICEGGKLGSVQDILKFSDGKSELADVNREGVVFKTHDGKFSFKAISNEYLLNGPQR